ALVARHLVVADTEDVETRYQMLETIRQYGQERLDERGETEAVRAAHAAYFLEFGETAIPDMSGPDGVEWERRLAQEFGNIRAALTWAIDIQDVDTAVRLLAMWDAPPIVTVFVPVSTVFWAADAVVDLPGASEHPRYAGALVVAAFSARNRGDYTIALLRSAE